MIRPAKNLLALCVLFGSLFFAETCYAQKNDDKKSTGKTEFYFDQYIMVTLKDGSEVPAKISSRKSKSVYLVKMIGGNRIGEVNKKFIRKMSPEEIKALKRERTIAKGGEGKS